MRGWDIEADLAHFDGGDLFGGVRGRGRVGRRGGVEGVERLVGAIGSSKLKDGLQEVVLHPELGAGEHGTWIMFMIRGTKTMTTTSSTSGFSIHDSKVLPAASSALGQLDWSPKSMTFD